MQSNQQNFNIDLCVGYKEKRQEVQQSSMMLLLE